MASGWMTGESESDSCVYKCNSLCRHIKSGSETYPASKPMGTMSYFCRSGAAYDVEINT
jgi:hypothetical protein